MKMSTGSQKIAPKSGQDDTSPPLTVASKRDRPYVHYMGYNAKNAVEECMKKAASAQEYIRQLLLWQDESDAELLELQSAINGLSKLDYRVPALENKVLRVRLRIKDLGGIAAGLSIEVASIERTLAYTLQTSKSIGALPKPSKDGGSPGGAGGDGGSQGEPKARGGPS